MDFAAKQKGAKKIGVAHTNDTFGQAGSDGVKAETKALGLTATVDVGYDGTETNFAPLGQRLAASGSDAIVIWAIPGSTQIMAAANQAGYKGIWLMGDLFRGGFYLSQLMKVPGIGGHAYLIFHQKTLTQFGVTSDLPALFKDAYPKGDPDPALTGWTGAAMFVQAVKEATAGGKPLTPDRLRQTLEGWKTPRSIESAVGVSYSATSHLGANQAQVLGLQPDFSYVVSQDFQPLPTVGG